MLLRIPPVLLLIAALPSLRAIEPAVAYAPFVPAAAVPTTPTETLGSYVAAHRALELGFPAIAAELYTRLLDSPKPAGADANALVIELVSALLDDGRTADAAQALQRYFGLPSAAYHVRAGLIAIRKKKPEVARAELAAVKPDDLDSGDRGWFYFLQGQVADAAGDFTRARDAYQQASTAAVSDLQRARFVLAREQARLNLGEVTETQLASLKQSAERYQGRSIGYSYARQYAVALAALGRNTEAVDYLQRQLDGLPVAERAAADDFRLITGLIDGAQNEKGRAALEELLASGRDPDLQRVALQLLARSSTDAALRGGFLGILDKLINGGQPHPILEDILLIRAQLALADKNYAQAEASAKELLAKFPGSPLKSAALGVQAGSAWEQHRYRTAADYAAQAKASLPAGDLRASLGVLVAEAYFRAQDFRSADDAYAAALNEIPSGVQPGVLMSQRVQSEIEDGRLEDAEKLLDGLEREGRFDEISRWQAEWLLSRALQIANRTADALARVNKLMVASGNAGAGLPADLRVRLAWLQAQLSLEAGTPEKTLELARKLTASLDGLDPVLRKEVEASTRLLEAKADFKLERAEEALALLKALRSDFPQADAAVYSYIDEADYYAGKNRFVDAQALLIRLADEFKQNDYAPYALYRAALNAERRSEDKYYKEAYTILERIVKEYPRNDLVFYARLKQGDLLRRLNQFGPAQQVYEFLINTYAQHASVLTARMALAACHRAQVGPSDVSHFESAITIYEQLQELPSAPVDMRVEAAFQLGDLLVTRGKPEDLVRAREVWWTLVTTFLLDDAQAAQLGVQGRYWTARTLLRLGDLRAQQGKLEEARNAYELILRKNLPFAKLARESFVRAGGKP
jgi:tetratricopeptide (TPR) repeat protein